IERLGKKHEAISLTDHLWEKSRVGSLKFAQPCIPYTQHTGFGLYPVPFRRANECTEGIIGEVACGGQNLPCCILDEAEHQGLVPECGIQRALQPGGHSVHPQSTYTNSLLRNSARARLSHGRDDPGRSPSLSATFARYSRTADASSSVGGRPQSSR